MNTNTNLIIAYFLVCSALVSVADVNSSRLSNIYQDTYFGGCADPFADPDGDLVSNRDEMFWGTNPTNAASRIIGPTAGLVGNRLQLTWPVAPYRTYHLEAGAGLSSWEIIASGAIGSYTEELSAAGTGGRRFYRLSVNLPSSTTQGPVLAGTMSGPEFRMTWVNASNHTYEIQSTSDFANWQTLSTNAVSPYVVNLNAPGTSPRRFYRLKLVGGSATGLEPWEEALYQEVTGHPLNATTDTDGDGLPDALEFPQSRNFLKKDHPAVGLIVFTPLEK